MKKIIITTIALLTFGNIQAQWYQVNSNTTENIKDVFFVDSLNGYCVGGGDPFGFPQGNGIIMETIEGGENWTELFSMDSLSINNVFIVTAGQNQKLIAFATKNGASYRVWTTINTPFQNWIVEPISYGPIEPQLYANTIYFLDQINGGMKKIENGDITNLLSTNDISLFNVSQIGVLYINNSVDSIFVDDLNGFITNLPQHPINIISSNQITDASIMQSGDTIILKGTYPSAVVYSFDNGGNWYYNNDGGEGKSLILETGQIISLHLNTNKILTTNDFGENWDEQIINGVVFTDIGYSKNNSSIFAFGKNGQIFKNANLVTIGINESELKKKINIYPNPAKDVLQIEINNNEQIKNVKLFDLQAKLIKEYKSGNLQLDVSKVPTGEYILSIETMEGIFTKKVVITR